jgi:PEP-CTERM motif
MKNMKLVWLAGLLLWLGSSAAMADSVVHVSLNTSPLSAGTYTLGFEFIDGDGVVDNSAVVSGFNLVGGSLVPGTDSAFGSATGNLGSSLSLDDSNSPAVFTQDFMVGTGLSFNVALTDNLAPGASTPDAFSFLLCDINRCYSDDASGALVIANLTGGSITPSDVLTFGDSSSGLEAPAVTPEPSSLMLLGGGLLGLVATMRRRRGH